MGGRLVGLKTDLLVLALWTAAAVAGVWIALGVAPRVLLELGPNDRPYLQGFRTGWEREGRTRFHWTTFSGVIRLPLRASGDGFLLRTRLRRHMTEPARVTVRIEGRAVHSFEIVGGSNYDYRIIDVPLPPLDGGHDFAVSFESATLDPRPLGVAIDWIEVVRGGSGRFRPGRSIAWYLAALVALAYAAGRTAGLRRPGSALHSAVLLLGAGVGLALDPIAFERILRCGVPIYAAAGLVSLAALRGTRARHLPPEITGLLVTLVLAALALRLVLLFHPRFYYPDVKIHGLVAYELSKQGLATFLDQLPAIQYRFSLGLQFENGHWYAFPYPPGFYLLAWPLLRFLPLEPDVVVAGIAALFNSLGVLITFVVCRFLLRSDRAALLGAVAHVALPLFLVRSALAYFPALTGHTIDACVLALLMVSLRSSRPRTMAILCGLIALALLMYTQALVNFGLVIPLFLLLDLLADRTSAGRRRQIGIALAAVVGVLLSIALFYGRYARFMIDMRRGVPMAEEQLLLDKQEQERRYAAATAAAGTAEEPPPEEVDPYAGPDLNPIRGLRKAVWRLVVFYGPFALSVLWGLVLLARLQEGPERRLVIAWAATYLILNLASGGLPSPNLLRYNKDLEVVAPLFCAALAATTHAISRRSRLAALVHLGAFALFGIWRGYETWRATFER